LTQLYRQSWARCFRQIQNHTIKQGSTDDFRFNIPVTFAEGVEADISVHSANYMDFAGGMTAYTIKRNGTEKDGSDYYRAYYCGTLRCLRKMRQGMSEGLAFSASGIQSGNGGMFLQGERQEYQACV
jgi:hypothetical protein